jgi:hypothetical protein
MRVIRSLPAALLASFVVLAFTAGAGGAAQPSGQVGKLTLAGTVNVATLSTATGTAGSGTTGELAPGFAFVNRRLPNRQNFAHVSAAHVPAPAGNALATSNPGFSGFNGLTHRDQRLAGGGNQFSLEPPDQALAVGNGFVLEGVNDALAVYSSSGALLAGPVTFSSFFKEAPIATRNTSGQIIAFGPFVFDPKAYFDAATNRWFVVEAEIDVDPVTGDFLGHSVEELAVSQTGDPRGKWNIYRIDTTDDGTHGTPSHTGCPCFGDQPDIGADANGFYISTNEFPIFVNGFDGAQLYAISKAQLAAGAANPTIVHIGGNPTTLAEGTAGSVQPGSTPAGGSFETAQGGTEYFLSSLDFTNTLDNRIAVWALTNTSSLNSASPSLNLSNVVIESEDYGIPPSALQEDGPLALGTALFGASAHTPLLDAGDDRMHPVTFAAGKLWGGVETVVKTANAGTQAAIAYFVVTPSVAGGTLTATITKQGYVSLNSEDVLYPTIGVNAAGKGVIGFSLAGPDFFPSSAYVPIDAVGGAGDIHIGAAGTGPEDGFTGYFGGNVARWGDYSAAVADADGTIWTANEFIPNAQRTFLANWGTFISHVTP